MYSCEFIRHEVDFFAVFARNRRAIVEFSGRPSQPADNRISPRATKCLCGNAGTKHGDQRNCVPSVVRATFGEEPDV